MSDRIHEPTPLRLQQAREQGNLARSSELAAALSMLGALVAAYLTVSQIGRWLVSWTSQLWRQAAATGWQSESSQQWTTELAALSFELAGILFPLLAMLFFVSAAGQWIQTGPVWNAHGLSPSNAQLGPGKWLDRLHPLRMLSVAWWSCPKILAAIGIMLYQIWNWHQDLLALASLPIPQMVSAMFWIVLQVSCTVAMSLAGVGVVDFALHWHRRRRRLRMTQQELEDEQRALDGDRVSRLRQRQLSRI